MIENKTKLLKGKFKTQRAKALKIIQAGLESVRVEKAIKKAKLPNLKEFDKIYVIGFGKASALMAETLEKRLGNRIEDGAVVSVRKAKTKRIQGFKGTHPLPSNENVKATEKIIEIIEKARRNDLVIALISGGGSALLTLPAKGITLTELREVNSLLIHSDVEIRELNTVRKHLSGVKGGLLIKKASPARLHAFIVSDVIGNDLSVIASGATVRDESTLRQAKNVLRKHGLWSKVPKSVQRHLIRPANETPKRIRRCENTIILDNSTALKAMQKKARELGFKAIVCSSELDGNTHHVGRFIVRKAAILSHSSAKPIALICGGETTLIVKGRGKGGRNQEMVLNVLKDLEKIKGAVFVSIGSDGIDGNSSAAGAIADSSTLQKAKGKKLKLERFLKKNDSNSFFKKVNGEIITGNTETNVMDLQLVLIK